MKKPVTQNDIAAKLKVSRITVSKALRNHPDISPAMKQKVLKTAGGLGYSPNMIAANLSQRRTNTLGVVIPDLENSFFAFLTDSIIDEAYENGYRIILAVSREKSGIEENNIRNLFGMRVDGMLVCVSQMTRDKSVFEPARRLNIPLVFFDRTVRAPGFSHVAFNDRQGMNEAVSALTAAGYSEFSHFSGYRRISIGLERCNSFKDSLMKAGLPVRDEWIIEGGFETEDGYLAFRKLTGMKKMPEVIIAVNDRVALGAYRAAAEAGLRIPDDIGIAGFGFSETASVFNPPLAVINQDPRLLGKEALRVLLDEIGGRITKPVKIRIGEKFILNGSVRITR